MQRKLFIAFSSVLISISSLVGQQKFAGRQFVQAPLPLSESSTPVPLAPPQMPASPPEVQFHQGQLTVTASNSTLGDILRAVGRETGALVDMPGNVTEPVVGQFGPGPARDVLTSLLNGSHFNYLLLGSADNPAALARVILSSRSSTNDRTVQTATASPPRQPEQVQYAPTGGLPPAIEAANARAMAARSVAITSPPADIDDMTDDSDPDAPDNDLANVHGITRQTEGQPPPPSAFGQSVPMKAPEQQQQQLQQPVVPKLDGDSPGHSLPQ